MHKIIVLGGSAGGLDALVKVVPDLPAGLQASVFVVFHVAPDMRSHLPAILTRIGRLPAEHARDLEDLRLGRIYIAPPDRHMVLEENCVHLSLGPRENHHRPAIDPLFRSAAQYYGPGVIGVLLSGALDDGVAGLLQIKRAGGLAVVQDPEDALVPSIPSCAIETVDVDYVMPAAKLGGLLVRLTEEEKQAARPSEDIVSGVGPEAVSEDIPMIFSCPECGGALVEKPQSNLVQYACRVGHVLSPETLVDAQGESIEAALWMAVRVLEERAAASEAIAARSRANGHIAVGARFSERARDSRERAAIVRRALPGRGREPPTGNDDKEGP